MIAIEFDMGTHAFHKDILWMWDGIKGINDDLKTTFGLESGKWFWTKVQFK